jgi:hypothetical protein
MFMYQENNIILCRVPDNNIFNLILICYFEILFA